MGDAIGIGLIGVGDIGRRHTTLLTSNSRARLVAAADELAVQLEPVKTAYAEVTTDWRVVVRHPEVEAVFVTTPPHRHREMTLAALDAGRHVFLEKPMAATVADADAIVERVRASDRVVLVGFQERHNLAFLEMRRAIQEGALGDVLYIRGTGRIPRKRVEKGWLFSTEQGGGAVLESSIHNWDLVRWLTGQEFLRVYGEGHVLERQGGRYEDTFVAIGRLSGGILVEIEATFSLPDGAPFDARIEILGTRGMAYYNLGQQPLIVNSEVGFSFGDRRVIGMATPDFMHMGPDVGAYHREHEHFFDCIQHGTAPLASAEDGRRSLAVALAVVESIHTGRVVTL